MLLCAKSTFYSLSGNRISEARPFFGFHHHEGDKPVQSSVGLCEGLNPVQQKLQYQDVQQQQYSKVVLVLDTLVPQVPDMIRALDDMDGVLVDIVRGTTRVGESMQLPAGVVIQ